MCGAPDRRRVPDDEGEAMSQGAGVMTRGKLLQRAAVGGAGLTAVGSVLASEGLAGGKGSGHAGGRVDGLEDRVNRVAQLVCNVSDLERAKAFWETHTPLRAYAKTATPLQSFRGLGIKRGQFEGYLLRDRWDVGDVLGRGQFELHLVQWKTPGPVGTPYSTSRNIGWYRLAFKTKDTQAKYDDLVSKGVTPYSAPPVNPPPPLLPVTGFGFPDPDGITIQILRGGADQPDRLSHLACPVPDLQRQLRVLRDTFGLALQSRSAQCAIPNPWDREGRPGPYEAFFVRARGSTNITFDIVNWGAPNPTSGRPYQDPTNLGYAQIVFEVADIREAYEILVHAQRRGGRNPDVVVAAPPEVWDLGPAVGTRTTLIVHDWLGIRYQLVETPPTPVAWDSPVSPAGPCPVL
jgi:catechol 2,3-dioxygenase-like lactoylglutathione lyase family enzyme